MQTQKQDQDQAGKQGTGVIQNEVYQNGNTKILSPEKFHSGPILYDEDEGLYYCKAGIETKSGIELHYTCWGKTETECRKRVHGLMLFYHGSLISKIAKPRF